MNRIITVPDGNGNMTTITIDKYITSINSWDLSMDAIEICNRFKIYELDYWSISAKTSLIVLDILRGNDVNNKRECELLHLYGITSNYSQTVRKNCGHLKWVIYANINNKNIDSELMYFIGLIAGVCLYFNELDIKTLYNTQTTSINYINLCKPFTHEDF